MNAGEQPECSACGASLVPVRVVRGRDLLHGTPGEFEVLVCRNCGAGLTLPLADDEELGSYYPGGYYAFAAAENRSRASRLLRYVPSLLLRRWRAKKLPISLLAAKGGGKLLDVGGGRGDLAVTATALGWRAVVLEPSEEACLSARERGVEAAVGTLEDSPLEARGEFDAVVFHHSLEHVSDPLAALKAARRHLKPDGMVIVSVPNFGCRQAAWFGPNWFHLDLPRHRTHLTREGMSQLFERAGMEAPEITTSTSTNGLLASSCYSIFGRLPSSLQLFFALEMAFLPLTVLARLADGQGDTLHAVWRGGGRPAT